MTTYQIPQTLPPPLLWPNEVFLIASGDLRLSANQTCWPAQANMERQITAAFATLVPKIRALKHWAHAFNPLGTQAATRRKP